MNYPKSNEFRQIAELIDLISKYKIREIEVIANPRTINKEPSRYWELYNGIADGKVNSDIEAAALMHMSESERKFKRLKKGLIERLISTIFFIDFNDTEIPTTNIVYYETMKNYTAMKILYTRGARMAAFSLAKKVLAKSLKFEFCELIVGSAQILQNFCVKLSKQEKEFERYRSLAIQYSKKHKYELEASSYYLELTVPFSNSKSTKKTIEQKAENAINILSKIPSEFRSRLFMLYLYMIKSTNETIKSNWDETIQVCEEAIEYFDRKGFNKENRTFYLQKSMAEIMSQNFQNAEISINECLKLTPSGSGNWFKTQEVKMFLFFHSERYSEAEVLLQKTLKNERINSITQADREMWTLFNAYTYILSDIGILPKRKSKFKLGKFLNNVPIFSKDKRGMNVPIIIVHFLSLLKSRQFDEADSRIESIMKYYQRHLKSDHSNYRTNCFLKMLECISKASYNRKQAELKAKRFKDKLLTANSGLINQSHEIEIIPYEKLWQICLICLEKLK